jgi:hypothetical protein
MWIEEYCGVLFNTQFLPLIMQEATKWHQFWSVKLTSDRMHVCFVHSWHYGITLMTIIAINTKITFIKALCKVLAIGCGE